MSVADVSVAIADACEAFELWTAGVPPWSNPPWVGDSRGYRGPTLLGEADSRMHLVRFLAARLPPEWLHQEVPCSRYLFPLAEVRRNSSIDIGIVSPARLRPDLTAADMQAVRWNALIEVKFRGDSPGWEFTFAKADQIKADVEKLERLQQYADSLHAVIVEELPPLDNAELACLTSSSVTVCFIRARAAPSGTRG